jgi:hypothetical protein
LITLESSSIKIEGINIKTETNCDTKSLKLFGDIDLGSKNQGINSIEILDSALDLGDLQSFIQLRTLASIKLTNTDIMMSSCEEAVIITGPM